MYRCEACGREYAREADAPWRCECGHALDLADPPVPSSGPPDPAALDRDRGLWAFGAFLPVARRVTLGEGWTPLVEAPAWGVQCKLEHLCPTGSFKDRGAATTLSLAAELGVDRVVEDSSGNAGLAVATYAARAGVEARVYVPADAGSGKLAAIERTGAEVVPVEGSRADVTDACVEAVEEGEGWYASHAWHPAFYAGTMTWAMELAAQRGWDVPDAVVTPLGHGTHYLGAYRGFRALERAGWIDEVPRLLGAQAAGYAPFASDYVENGRDGGADAEDEGESSAVNERAAGVRIRAPARADQVRDAIAATDGTVVAVDAAATERATERLALAGFDVAPTSAVALAALDAFRQRGTVSAADDVVVALTGRRR